MANEDEPQRFTIDTVEKLEAWTGDIDAWNAWGTEHGGDRFAPLDPEKPTHPTLTGDAAMALWGRGKKAWNAWTERNPEASIDFSSQQFGGDDYGSIYFAFYCFPKGSGEVDFSEAKFIAKFIEFSCSQFGGGEVTFDGATFRAEKVNFFNSRFDDTKVSFREVAFDSDEVYFFASNFSGPSTVFNNAKFGSCKIDFKDCNFDSEMTLFFGITVEAGKLNFSYSKFEGRFDITSSGVGDTSVSFFEATFCDCAFFQSLDDTSNCDLFTFAGATFESSFVFSANGRIGCPLDLRRTSIAHDVVVQDIRCDYQREAQRGANPFSTWLSRAADPEDSQRFRKLKELAVANRNHAKALEFHAQEIRTQRGHGTTKLQDLAQFLYWIASDYGRSVKRPFGWLIALWLGFAGLYWQSRTAFGDFPAKAFALVEGLTRDFGTVLGYSGSNMLAFIPTGGTARQQGIELLYGGQVPDWVLLMAGVQSILAVILLFLLGLGLRNMFRV